MAEEIKDKFHGSMKRGFLYIFILTILKENPSHGYHIKKEIGNRTFDLLTPADSTLYTALKDLTKKNLVVFSELQDGDRPRKVYEVTKEGVQVLEKLMFEYHGIFEKFVMILSSITGDDELDKERVKKQIHFTPLHFITNPSKDFSLKEKIHHLSFYKEKMTKEIARLSKMLNKMDEKLEELKKRDEMDNI